MSTHSEDTAALNGRHIVGNSPDRGTKLEYVMSKPNLHSRTRVHRGGVAPP